MPNLHSASYSVPLMKLRHILIVSLCLLLAYSTSPGQAASSPFPDKGPSASSSRLALSFPEEPRDERVPPGAVPTKESIEGLDSRLSHLARLAKRGELASIEAAGKEQGLQIRGGLVQAVAEVEASALSQVREAVTRVGGHVEADHESLLQVAVPPEALDQLAHTPGVRYVRAPDYPVVLDAMSEGVESMGLGPWYGAGFRGRGIKIAVADVGFDAYWNLLGTELPAQPVVNSFRPDGDITGGGNPHGTAAAEIVYDVAPEATLYLVNFSTEVELGQAVDWLISQRVDVISSSVGWPGTAFGDGTGTVDEMVKKADRAGILWVQAAGNFAQTHWTRFFNDPDGNGFNNFAPTDEGNTVSLRQSGPNQEQIFRVEIFLTWDDWVSMTEDYDLFLFRGDGVVAQSTAFQNGKFPPVEHIVYTTAAQGDYWIAIQRFRATKRAKLDLVVTIDYGLEHKVSQESLVVPADSPLALTVGAVEPGTLAVRPYSSQGPTKVGLTKPDLVAPDQVTTVTYGPKGFSGTSASVPYVAAAAALVKQARPTLTPAELRTFLTQNALGPGFANKNSILGAGRLFMGEVLGRLFFPMVAKGAPVPPPP